MRPSLIVLASVVVAPIAAVADGGGRFAQPPADPGAKAQPQPAAGELAPGTTALAPISEGSLTLVPLVAAPDAEAEAEADLMVLDEAMAKKLVRIREVDEDGSVNSLRLTNRARRPVFLLAGEVILGGKQDRIIGQNTIIPARTTLEVPVFCVEHGRWTDEGAKHEFRSARALAHGRLRAKATFAAQGDVWEEVAAKNTQRDTANATDTYRAVAAQQVGGTVAEGERRVRAALDKLPARDRTRMVGYAVAINGAVVSVDMFGSPGLFKKLETKLLRSYLTESIDAPADAAATAPTVADVRSFMADADAATGADAYETEAAATDVQAGRRAARASVKRKATDAAAPAAKDVFVNYSAQDATDAGQVQRRPTRRDAEE